jgi:hypothetical protein
MLNAAIDHITITAPTLAAGVEHVRKVLGVTMPAGGEHPKMGTHNCLLRLGADLFLEVIAVNPEAPRPDWPRWFELDRLQPDAGPRLAVWVARTNDIRSAIKASPVALGEIEPMSRGMLDWLISIPSDGSLPLQGAAPALIQWQASTHPAAAMPDLGCSLIRLDVFHPQPARIAELLHDIGFAGPLGLHAREQPGLAAHILTPQGERILQ